MSFVRALLAARPLMAHVTFGASSAAGIHLAFYDSRVEEGEDANGSPWAPPRSVGGMELDDEFWTDLIAAAVTGGLQGGAMRYWYPALEGFAQRWFASSAAQTAAKIAMDAAPAAVSTFGFHALAMYYYRRNYGGLSDPDSLFERLQDIAANLADEATSVIERHEHEKQGGKPSLPDYSSSGADSEYDDEQRRQDDALVADAIAEYLQVSPDSLPLEEIEAIDAVLDTRPTLANYVTAAISLLNFMLVPRQLRGLVGTLQWQVYEAGSTILLDSEERERPLSIESHWSLHKHDDDDGKGGSGGASVELRIEQDVVLPVGDGNNSNGNARRRPASGGDRRRPATPARGDDDGSSDEGGFDSDSYDDPYLDQQQTQQRDRAGGRDGSSRPRQVLK